MDFSIEKELKALQVLNERIDTFKKFADSGSMSTVSAEWAMINILGITKEDAEAIRRRRIMKVKEWKNNKL